MLTGELFWQLSPLIQIRMGAVKAPSLLLILSELPRALLETGSLPWAAPFLLQAPKGDGHPVMLLPGLYGFGIFDAGTCIAISKNWAMTHIIGNWAVIWAIRRWGKKAKRMIARLDEIYAKTGKKVSLVGWSLGGSFARMLSRRRLDHDPSGHFSGFTDHRHAQIDKCLARLSICDRTKA